MPPDTSNAMPYGSLNPVVTRSSICVPSRLARWILLVYPALGAYPSLSVQYILPSDTSNAIPPGTLNPSALVTRSSICVPSRLARWILSVWLFVQYILRPITSTAMCNGQIDPVTRSSTCVPSKLERWIFPRPPSVQYILCALWSSRGLTTGSWLSPVTSNAMSPAPPIPVTKSSTPVPSRLER